MGLSHDQTALPQGYILRQGTLIENFGTFADWTADYAPDGSIAIDTEHFKVTQSLKINALATKTMLAHKTVNLDLTNMGCIRLYCYIPDVVNPGRDKGAL